MTIHDNYEYFLYLTEEKKISLAAERAHVTQQAMSKYLQHLEESLGLILFYRRPTLTLTQDGESFFRYVCKVRDLNSDFINEVTANNEEVRKTLKIGCSSGMAESILPQILRRYYQKYPYVRIHIELGTTKDLAKQLSTGAIDLLIGISIDRYEGNHTIISLQKDPILFVISDSMLKAYFSDEYPACVERFKDGIELRQFTRVPFSLGSEKSTTGAFVRKYLYDNNIVMNEVFTVDNTQVQLSLIDCAATLLPNDLRGAIRRSNENPAQESHIYMFPVPEVNFFYNTQVAYYKGRSKPPYFEHLIILLHQYFTQ